MSKPKGRKMEGLGKRHSTTLDQRIVGHSLVQGLYQGFTPAASRRM